MTERYEEYHFYKGLKICVRCHKEVAEPNKVMCYECLEKENQYMREKRKSKEAREKDLSKYYELKERGICTYCKKAKAIEGRTKCKKCLDKIRNKRNSKKCDIDRSERVSYGLCYICGNDGLYQDTHVCEKCYKKRYESISKIMYDKASNNCWKQDNKAVFNKS